MAGYQPATLSPPLTRPSPPDHTDTPDSPSDEANDKEATVGILKTAATVAVASSVHGRVQRRQQNRWASQDQAAAGVPAPPPPAQYAAPAQPPPAYAEPVS